MSKKFTAIKDAISYLSLAIGSYLEKYEYMDDIDMLELQAFIVDYSEKIEKDIENNNGLLSLDMMNRHYSFCLNEIFEKFNINQIRFKVD